MWAEVRNWSKILLLAAAASGQAPQPATPLPPLRLIEKPAPVIPEVDKTFPRTIGDVRLSIKIGVDGKVVSVAVISGPVPLQRAAVECVKRWIYAPYVVNGVVRPVSTTVTISFH